MIRAHAVLIAAMLAMGLSAARAQQPSSDDSAIRAVLARETEGWGKFDAKEIASVFTSDATWQNPFGVRLHGRTELERFLTDLLARPGYRAGKTTPAKILELRLTSPTTAAVWSDDRIEGLVNDMSGQPMQPRHSYYLRVLMKQGGEWKISDMLVMDIVHLK
jgi:uncharacterized protein (TIGR02246 family)